jgi:Protein of unknown function (DUF3015)
MKLLIALMVVLLGAGQAGIVSAYGNPDTGPGCGLGKLLWADFKRQKDIAPQVLMVTTNASFGSQTFGISLGTSGCTNDGKVWAEQKTEFFVAATFDNLVADMARGEGEHLTVLATLLGVPAGDREVFYARVQARYRELVHGGEVSPGMLIESLHRVMAQHVVLADSEVRN